MLDGLFSCGAEEINLAILKKKKKKKKKKKGLPTYPIFFPACNLNHSYNFIWPKHKSSVHLHTPSKFLPIHSNAWATYVGQNGLGSSVGRASALRSGGTGFDPRPRHTKVVNNGTSCSPLGTRIFKVGLELVAPVSV